MDTRCVQIDEAYEFSAPMFFDFLIEETEESIRNAELWFELSLSHAPSPFVSRVKEGRKSIKIETLCDFDDVEMETEKESDLQDQNKQEANVTGVIQKNARVEEMKHENKEETRGIRAISFGFVQDAPQIQNETSQVAPSSSEAPSFNFPVQPLKEMEVAITGSSTPKIVPTSSRNRIRTEAVTPKMHALQSVVRITGPSSSRNLTTKKTNEYRIKSRNDTPHPVQKTNEYISLIMSRNAKANTEIAQQNQAVKRQKLDNGRTRQILNVKPTDLAHKSRPDPTTNTTAIRKSQNDYSHALKGGAPFVSAAEVVKKFECGTRNLSHDESIQTRPRLALTRPKEPEFQTSQRARAVRIKSSEELESEMLAKIPKFKAKPINKKIFEAPHLPPLPKSTPHLTEFKEFNLKTMERANKHAETSSQASSADFTFKSERKTLKLTEPRAPCLQTSMRARPPTVKSSQELELEELDKAPKFKAKPLNRKILEGKVEISHPNYKPPLTTPKEFHFATDDRMGPAAPVFDQFDKLSLLSEASSFHSQKDAVPKLTLPNPFHFQTDERGMQKEMMLQAQLQRRKQEEENARVRRATPYPYTTDYPVVPPKPEPKPCTRAEGFQLESLVRHEQEMQRIMEERERMEREEAQRRLFRAQPILKEDPIPVPAKERRPLTEVQGFVLHADQRSLQRQEFDNQIKEKDTMYKRMREEAESAKQMEDEKALKQLRRTMVPHARPLPKFENPFIPQRSSKEITKPKSPHLHIDEIAMKRMRQSNFLR